jgi:diguanylate cyclase (GGDEF)-like protein
MDTAVFTSAILLVIVVPTAITIGAMAWRSRSLPGARPFLLLVFLAFWWAVADAVERMTPGLDAKLIWANLQYVPITLIPAAWVVMTIDYAARHWRRNIKFVAALCLVPLITNVFVWTDPYHHLMRSAVWLDTTGAYSFIDRTVGPWFWVHLVYSLLLMAIATALLVATVFSAPSFGRRQPAAILAGSLLPLAATLGHAFVPATSMPHLTPLAFALGAIAVAWGLLRVRLFNLVPIARHGLVENMRDGVLVLDSSQCVVDINRTAQILIGRPASQILGRPIDDTWKAWEQIAAPYAAGADQAELSLGDNGRRGFFQVKWSPLNRHGQVVARVMVLSDVTERRVLEDSLRDQALTDGLTGLPNRACFMSRLSDAVHRARRHDEVLFAVLVLDIDRFKVVNDSLGHLAGDILLQSVAAKLKRCVREADTVARMGGDEFIILLHELSTSRDLLPVLDRIQEELQAPVHFQEQELTVTASVGVVIWDPSYDDPDDLVRAADTAMYQAKASGRGCHRIFDDQMHKAVLRTLKDETDLRIAIRERAFSLAYQPVVNMKTGALRSLEALLRWHHPERGTIFPRDFVTVAEDSGLILALGEIALDELCAQMKEWQFSSHPVSRLPVSLNVSSRQLIERDFVSSTLGRLGHWRIPSERLVLEITESALTVDPPKAKQAMRKLRGLGVRLCLDDFGAGGSCLHHLTAYPLHELKIEPAFLSAIEPGNKHLETLRHLTALAHALSLEVTAEGVESAKQWELLRQAGCDYAQGYYVASPLEPELLLDFLDDLQSAASTNSAAAPDDTSHASPNTADRGMAESAPVWLMRHLLGEGAGSPGYHPPAPERPSA